MQRRTHVLRLIISLFVLAAFLVSCAPPTPEETAVVTEPTAAPTRAVVSVATATLAPTLPPPAKYKEAPELAEQVAAGSLPPVEERLPENPKVVQPAESIGIYGGVIRRLAKPSADGANFTRTIFYESLVTWTPDWTGIQPDIAEAFEVSEDATTYTFHLRKGMKWSDGDDYTSEDIRFWYEDMIMNDDLTPAKPGWLKSGDEVATMEFPDDYTVIVKFAKPNGLFLSRLATPDAMDLSRTPSHWMKQFHTKYGDQAQIDAWIKEGQFEQWRDMWGQKTSIEQNPDRPSIHAWEMVDPYVGGATQVTFDRNPYYWKVDTEGQQLPYIDRAVFTLIDSVDAMVPKALNGEVDQQDRHLATDPNKPLFIDNQEKGGYRLYNTFSGSLNRMSIMFNLNHLDPVKNEIFNNKDFRIGLSHAINRQEIIETVYVGVGEPWQTAPLPSSPFYDEELAKQYTEYDLDLANEYLDKAGYMKDANGRRLGPDGKPISFVVEVVDALNPQWIDMLNMISKYWGEVGIDMQPKVLERSIFYANKQAYLHDAGVWSTSGFLAEVLLDPRYFIPYSNESIWANCWADWYNGAAAGKDCEPPDVVKESLDIYESMKNTADVEEQIRLGKEMIDIAKENFWSIGIASAPDSYGIVKTNMHNFIDHPGGWLYPNPGPINPETWYYDPPQQ